MQKSSPKFARTSALIGAIAWLIVALIRISPSGETNLINKILLLGILVIVPLALSLVETPDRTDRHSLPYRLAVWTQPLGALAVLVSFLLEAGLPAAILASLWLIVTSLIAAFGVWRLLPRGFHPAEEVSIDFGLVYLPVGGVWLVMSRLGIQAFGFGDTIVLLTAVHFHFAGFAAPILAGLAGRLIGASVFARQIFRVSIALLVFGIPLVAAGITTSPLLALVGATVLSLGLLLLALTVMSSVMRAVRSLPAQILLAFSSVSSVLAMLMASTYAYSIVAKKLIIGIPEMAMTHGVLNAFGFALSGLTAWLIVGPPSRAPVPGIPFSRLSAGKFAGSDYFQRIGAVSSSKPPALGLVDHFSIYDRTDFDPASVHPSVRSFYEETYRYRLIVRPYWRPGFRTGGRIANRIGGMLGQLRLPISTEGLHDRIESKLFQLDDSIDGRNDVRAWVRVFEGTNEAMYVAAYAAHTESGNTYMNIAFPLLGGNLSSILNVESRAEPSGSITLSTWPAVHARGDQGVYFANRFLPVRLPMNEVITVWASDLVDSESKTKEPLVKATHEIWLFGVRFLVLAYDIYRFD